MKRIFFCIINCPKKRFISLTFRELFGNIPLKCFDGIIQRLSAQTAFTAKREKSVLVRLKEVAVNPFSDWRYSDSDISLDTSGVSSSSRPGSRNSDRISPTPGSKRAGSVETEESSVKKPKSGDAVERKSPSQISG